MKACDKHPESKRLKDGRCVKCVLAAAGALMRVGMTDLDIIDDILRTASKRGR